MLTKSKPTPINKEDIEDRIQRSFQDVSRYEDFLLDDVGIVISNKAGKSEDRAKQWGVIATGDGKKITYLYGNSSAVSRYRLTEEGKRILVPSKQELTRNTPVTFCRHRKNPSWAFKVVAWEPEVFEDLIGGQNLYRLVECSAMFGTLYRPGRGQPRNLRTIWEGSNLDSLRSKYPQDLWPVRDRGSKPMHFEKREEGAWKLCSDPR